MHVSCLAKRWHHHTASGGYDRLAPETGATVFERTEGSRISAPRFETVMAYEVSHQLVSDRLQV